MGKVAYHSQTMKLIGMVHILAAGKFISRCTMKKILMLALFLTVRLAHGQVGVQEPVHPKDREWSRTFDIIWESRWHQSGHLLPATRWPIQHKSIKYSINSGASSGNAQRARLALRKITDLIGWEAIEVPDSSPEAQIQFNIRTYTDQELRVSTCRAQGERKGAMYVKQVLDMSEQHTYRCVLHELMHAFGFPGHPQGNTVLSYFEGNQLNLKPIDEFLLKAWYSDTITLDDSPLLSVLELNRLWVIQHVPADQQSAAVQSLQRWQATTFGELEKFALGKGEPPAVLYRSGRLTTEGLRLGRSYIQQILGLDHLRGVILERDAHKAFELLLLSAKNENRSALSILMREAEKQVWQRPQVQTLCEWMVNDTTGLMSRLKPEARDAFLKDQCERAGAQ
jgi:hypothetical protein